MSHGNIGRSLTVTLLAASVVPAHAQSNWTGAISDNWFLSENWIGGVPRQTSEAIVDTVTPNSAQIGIAGATAQNLAIGQGAPGRLVIQSEGTLITSFGVAGNFWSGVGTV